MTDPLEKPLATTDEGKKRGVSSNPFDALNAAMRDKDHVLCGQLGGGGMGDVYLARDKKLKRRVAFKQLKSGPGETNVGARFVREARITAELMHPAIVPIYSLVAGIEGQPAYTMHVIEGQNLAELLGEARRRAQLGAPLAGRYALGRRLDLFVRACEAISHAHHNGVLHRDLKPANIMVDAQEQVYVVDWGLARRIETVSQDAPHERIPMGASDQQVAHNTALTMPGEIIGTPAYTSPERLRGDAAALDYTSDQYALGVILFELVFLRRAFNQPTLPELVRAVRDGKPSPFQASSRRERIRPELVAIVKKAMANEPTARYPSVAALIDDLRCFLHDDPVAAAPDSLLQKAARLVSRYRRAVVVLLALLAMAGAVAVAGRLVYEQRRQLAASERHRQIGMRLMQLVEQARELDLWIQRIEGSLGRLAEATRLVLRQRGPKPAVYHLNERFAPPDLVSSTFYRDQISLGWPVVKLAPGLSEATAQPRLRQLTPLRPVLRDLVLGSVPQDDDQDPEQLLVAGGLQLLSAFVATAEGIIMLYPGRGGYASDYDPRQRPWYRSALGNRGLVWSKPYVSTQKIRAPLIGLVLGMRDESGRLQAVAGVDVHLDKVARQVASRLEAVPWADEALLLNQQARILIRAQRQGSGVSMEEPQLDQAPHWSDEVSRAVMAREPHGFFETHRDHQPRFLAFAQLSSMPSWFLVFEGPLPAGTGLPLSLK